MDDELMKCTTCGTPRVSRYAAYCHICGSPLPELPPEPDAVVESVPAQQGRNDPAAAPLRAAPPADQPPQGGAVRVYDRPEVPPSVVRRRRLTLILLGVGLLVSLLLALGPLRSALNARNQPAWTPGGAETPVMTVISTLPPGVSAAQATARARNTAIVAPTWTAGVDIGTPTGGGAGAVATVALPTLALAATTTPAPTATAAAPTAMQSPGATQVAGTQTPPATLAAPTAAANSIPGASLPGAIGGGKVVAFVSDRTGGPQIWITDMTGANQIPVTFDGQNTNPAWSFDNRYLYYLGQRAGQTSVYRLDITTGIEEQVLQDPSLVSARPLPNGQLAIMRMEDGRHTLYIDDRRLFQFDRSFQYQFSPNGRRVIIDPNSDPRAISVVDVATTAAQEVAPARSWNASWGQGDRLTYVSDRSGIAAVYVAGSTGEGARAVSPADKWSQAPAFSSDGSQVAFIGGDGPAWNVYVVGSNGQNAARVGGPASPSKTPTWQPGGALIAYESDRAGNWDIFVTDPNGQERPLTTDPANDVDPVWTW